MVGPANDASHYVHLSYSTVKFILLRRVAKRSLFINNMTMLRRFIPGSPPSLLCCTLENEQKQAHLSKNTTTTNHFLKDFTLCRNTRVIYSKSLANASCTINAWPKITVCSSSHTTAVPRQRRRLAANRIDTSLTYGWLPPIDIMVLQSACKFQTFYDIIAEIWTLSNTLKRYDLSRNAI